MKVLTRLSVICWMVFTSHAFAQVKVFTDSTIPVSNTGNAEIFLLDQPRLLEQQLSAGLPGNIDQAEQVALARLQTTDGQQLMQQLIDAHRGVVMAWQLKITKLPAVVVDDRYVVYGQTDIGQAVAAINRAKNKESGAYQLPTR